MAKQPQLKVISESKTGRNTKFQDTQTNETMSRAQAVKKINAGIYGDDYYVRKQNGLDTPVSKPNRNKNDNLG